MTRLPPRFYSALVLALAIPLAFSGCSSADRPGPQPALVPAHAAPVTSRPRLVFFMNPNGRPCQMQDQILRAMPDLPARAEVVYYRTTEPGDIARFEQYGIRSIPQLIVTDAGGVELRRATPGIQADAQVRQLVGP